MLRTAPAGKNRKLDFLTNNRVFHHFSYRSVAGILMFSLHYFHRTCIYNECIPETKLQFSICLLLFNEITSEASIGRAKYILKAIPIIFFVSPVPGQFFYTHSVFATQCGVKQRKSLERSNFVCPKEASIDIILSFKFCILKWVMF